MEGHYERLNEKDVFVTYYGIIYLTVSMKKRRKRFCFLCRPPAGRGTGLKRNKYENGNTKNQAQNMAPSF
jgi:hypothetical protein